MKIWWLWMYKWVFLFNLYFQKPPVWEQMAMLSPKISLFHEIGQKKKKIQRLKNSCNLSENGHWTLKTRLKKNGTPEDTSSFFHLKGPYFSTRSVTNKLKNLFKEKEVGVTHQITGIWPKKHLQNPEKQFSSISYLKEFAESGLETVFLVAMKRL